MRGACVADGQVGMDIGEVLGILADLMDCSDWVVGGRGVE
jgi:hypothetical protein